MGRGVPPRNAPNSPGWIGIPHLIKKRCACLAAFRVSVLLLKLAVLIDLGSTRVHNTNDISTASAILAQLVVGTNRQTDRQAVDR